MSRHGHGEQRREKKMRDVRRRASKADSLGRKVAPTIEAYEGLAAKSADKLAQALIARHTLRMDAIRFTNELRQLPILSALVPITILDLALTHSGATPTRPPAAYVGGWVDHLAWGVDSAVAAARLLLCGQVVGAAAVARNQLERWTVHRASNAGLEQRPGESTVEYVARVWTAEDSFHAGWFATDNAPAPLGEPESQSDEPALDHKHVEISDGSWICPAVLYALLSEIMHGRALPEALAWDSTGLLRSDDWPDEMLVAVGVVVDTITLCLLELRVAAAALATQAGNRQSVEVLRASLDKFSRPVAGVDDPTERGNTKAARPPQLSTPPLPTLIPLLPNEGLDPSAYRPVVQLASVYAAVLSGQRPAGRLFRDDEMVMYAFGWHRARSMRAAQRALEIERRMLGERFSVDGLTSRSTQWVLLTEAVSLLGRWHDRPESQAAATLIGTALRSAYWLWLEDDDRAMSVLRCVLEQTARLRAWRLKPQKAATLEARPESTPRDWLEAAGWKRLTALNRALGELAHAKSTSRWTGARELLAKFQIDVDDQEAIYTARGASIDFVAQLLVQELQDEMMIISPTIAEGLRQVFLVVGLDPTQQSQTVDAQLDHIWSHRAAGLGTGDSILIPRPRGTTLPTESQ
jgi:hypothetical protein